MARFTGTIVGERGTLVFADATLTVGKKKTVERREGPGTLELAIEGGRVLEVRDVVGADKRGRVKLDDTYGELVSHPIARLFDAKAPGDHVKASILGVGLFAGDTITVEGEVLEERVVSRDEASGGLREAPEREATVVRATRITLGAHDPKNDDDPVEERTKEASGQTKSGPKPETRRARVPLEISSFVLLGLGVPLATITLMASWVAPLVPDRAWLTPLFGAGLALTLVGLHRLVAARWHASYATIIGGRRLTPWEPIRWYETEPYLLVFGYFSWCWLCALEPSPSAVTVCIAACAVLPAVHLVQRFLHERPFRQLASLALAFPSRGDPGGGRMLLAEGTVVSPRTAIRRRVEHIPKTERYLSTDKNGHTHERTTTVLRDREHTSAETFTLALDSGGLRVEVDPKGAHVALSRRTWKPHASLAVYEETLQEGDRACVAARFETREDGTLRAAERGDESLFVYAGSRSQLSLALLAARLRLVAWALLTLLPVVLGLYAFPFGARFHATATVTSSSGVVPVGGTCTLRVLAHRYASRPKCSVRLSCGDASYGGFGMGQMDCSFTDDALEPSARGEDASYYDGDPAVAFSLPERTLTWVDESGGSFTATLGPAAPSLWW